MPQSQHIVLTVNAAWNIVNFRMPLVRALIASGHRVTVLAPADNSVKKLTDAGCAFVDLKMDKKGLNPLRDASLALEFRKHFRELTPDIVLSFTIKNNIFGALAAKSLGIAFVPNVTGLGTAFLSNGILLLVARLLYMAAFRGLPVVFFQNEDDRTLFLTLGLVQEPQCRLLPGSGIDLSEFGPASYPDTKNGLRFLFVGRVIRDKGVREFVEAAKIVRKELPDARFQILGAIGFENITSIPRDEVEQWVKDGAIEYLGTTDDVRTPVRDAHCVVLPSYREGAPRTLIEGAALARPAIATNVPGCSAVVEDGITGLLCRVRDAGDLASHMLKFARLGTPAQTAMGRAARDKIAREYDVKHVIKAYQQVVSEIGA